MLWNRCIYVWLPLPYMVLYIGPPCPFLYKPLQALLENPGFLYPLCSMQISSLFKDFFNFLILDIFMKSKNVHFVKSDRTFVFSFCKKYFMNHSRTIEQPLQTW